MLSRKKIFFISVWVGTLIALASCSDTEQDVSNKPFPPPVDQKEDAFSSASYSFAAVDSFRGKPYLIYILDPKTQDIRIFNPRPEGGVHTFESIHTRAQEEGCEMVFAMNGGMYQKNRTAQGLLVIGGTKLNSLVRKKEGYGNFYMQPNGVFVIDKRGTGHVVVTDAYDGLASKVSVAYATQSGPMLLVNKKINDHFNDGSPNVHIRNAVGVTETGNLVFAISKERVTFYELSAFMLQKGCVHALYLDGFVSKAYLPEIQEGSLSDGQGLGPLIAIFK